MRSWKSLFSLALLLTLTTVTLSVSCVEGANRIEKAAFRPRSHISSAAADRTDLSPRRSIRKEASLKHAAFSLRGGVANTLPNAFAGSLVMALIEKGVKELFKANDIKFPAQLAACLFLFAFLLITDLVMPDLANSIFAALTPGAALLAKWLPVFFVPALAMLPLSPPIGSSFEIAKVIAVCVIGFIYTVMTTVFAVLAVKGEASSAIGETKVAPTADSTPSKPFSDETASFFLKGTILFGISSVFANKSGNAYATPLNTAFLGFLTFYLYVWGARLPAGFVKVVHPLVTSSVLLLVFIRLLAPVQGYDDYLDYLRTYKVGSLDPMKAGAGDILLYLLGPSVVSFAISMYSRRTLLKSNLLVVLTAMFVSSAGGLFGTAAFVRLISLGGSDGSVVRLSVLARNVTTALAMAVTGILGGDISIAAAVVSLTAIIGGTYGKPLLNYMGIKDPIVRGLTIGSSSQGLGVAAIANETDAFPFAAISMIMTAIAATTLVSFPAVRDALIKVATGN